MPERDQLQPGAPRRAGARALGTALACVLLGLGFGASVWIRRGPSAGQQYLSAYLIELSLSVDNVFMFALVFRHFGVDARLQRRLLFWGLAGAVVMRAAFLAAGLAAITRFAWVVPVLGALILVTGVRLALAAGGRRIDPAGGALGRLAARHAPKALAAFVVLETADLVFALDSLPAVIAVTHDYAIAVLSNLFAILGLRSLFLVVGAAMQRLRFLDAGLAAVLGFIGLKMIAEPWYPVPAGASLAVIAALIGASAAASLAAPARTGAQGGDGT
jgi:tellurite resistance protein TerC